LTGVDAAEPVADRRGFPAAVEQLQPGHVSEAARLQQVEEGRLPALEHDQVGFHGIALHFDPIGILAGQFFINGPGNRAVIIKAVSFENDLVLDMLFFRDSFQEETPLPVRHGIIPARPLEGEQDGTGRRVLGKQFPVQQETGIALHR
jgi:hypothetical protein